MPSLIWTPPALADVQRLHGFLLRQDAEAARRAVRTISHGVRLLAQQPRAGRPAEGMDAAYREWPVAFGRSGYVVLYRLDGDRVSILAVWHQREAGW